jgi:hypothetical protein
VSGDFAGQELLRGAYQQRRRRLPRSALYLPPPPSWWQDSYPGRLHKGPHYYPYLGMSSFFKRHQAVDEPDTDEENDDTIDPELRLRTVRTAASAIAESIKSEQRAERRKTMHKRSRFFRRHAPEKKPIPAPSEPTSSALKAPGPRRNVYVNYPLSAMEVDQDGEPKARYVRNKVRTTSE